jgi:hypothetical protein
VGRLDVATVRAHDVLDVVAGLASQGIYAYDESFKAGRG